jgi:hypothetical protein
MSKLGRAISTAMTGLGVSLGSVAPKALFEEIERLLDVVQELDLATARRAVH